MTRTPATASLAIASAVVGASVLSGTVAVPVAYASPLAPIIGTVQKDRSVTRCPQYAYNPVLEGAAQGFVRSPFQAFQPPGNYNGRTVGFIGVGDPQAAATTAAYESGAGPTISDCGFTEFGVGFRRNESSEEDFVAIVFGAPAPAAPPVEAPKPEPVSVPDPPKAAPTNAVQLSFDRGTGTWTANVTSTADIPGKCSYVASNPVLPAFKKFFDIGPNGSASFDVLAPPPFSTYHVVVACKGPFEGNTVEFGRVEMNVP